MFTLPLMPYDQDQLFLFPPSLNEWVRQDHPVRVFSEIIERVNIPAFRESKEQGRPAYHPKMMAKVLLWGYVTGVRSSRKIEEKLQHDIAFMWLAGLEKPDFRTLCLFRANNKSLLERIFTEVLMIAKAIGMGSLGLIALDGSKVRSNSDIDTFKTVQEWKKILGETNREAQRIIGDAERIDREEDKLNGEEKRGDELPQGMGTLQNRIEKIEKLIKRTQEMGKEDMARVSLSDGEASFMHKANTSIPAYNAQLAVTEDQLIIHADVTAEPIDVNQTKKAIEKIEQITKETPAIVVADTGYGDGENLRYLEEKKIDAYIPEEGERHIGKRKRPRAHLFGKEDFT